MLFVFGVVFGSFANVVIWRYPRGESVSHPPSACPRCGTPIRWYDNIPLVSWLVLRGRCRDCGEPISVRYPLVELLSGVLWFAAGIRFGMTSQTAWAILLFYLLMILAFIDLDTMRLPNALVAGLFVSGAVGAIFGQLTGVPAVPLVGTGQGPWLAPVPAALIGSLSSAAVALLIAVAYASVRRREGFGMGDVKLLAAIGMFLGPYGVAVLFVGSVLGTVYGLVASRRHDGSLAFRFPFGPFLALAAVLVALYGPAVWTWYAGLLG